MLVVVGFSWWIVKNAGFRPHKGFTFIIIVKVNVRFDLLVSFIIKNKFIKCSFLASTSKLIDYNVSILNLNLFYSALFYLFFNRVLQCHLLVLQTFPLHLAPCSGTCMPFCFFPLSYCHFSLMWLSIWSRRNCINYELQYSSC